MQHDNISLMLLIVTFTYFIAVGWKHDKSYINFSIPRKTCCKILWVYVWEHEIHFALHFHYVLNGLGVPVLVIIATCLHGDACHSDCDIKCMSFLWVYNWEYRILFCSVNWDIQKNSSGHTCCQILKPFTMGGPIGQMSYFLSQRNY